MLSIRVNAEVLIYALLLHLPRDEGLLMIYSCILQGRVFAQLQRSALIE